MSTRTFKQTGQGYGSLPTTITAKIDGQIVFTGPVETSNQPLPVLPNLDFRCDNTLFSWTRDTAFSGTIALEISVDGSPLLLTETVADYLVNSADNQGVFNGFYSFDQDGVIYADPLSNETIDGILVSRDNDTELTGQWYWTIMPGSTFSATINVLASLEPPPPPSGT